MDITSLLRDMTRTDERAVSPVLGVALLIAITVILAGVIGAVVLGVGADSGESPSASLDVSADTSNNDVTIAHEGGDPINVDNLEVVVGTSSTAASGSTLTAGDSTTVSVSSVSSGDTIKVVWNDPNSDKTAVLATHTV